MNVILADDERLIRSSLRSMLEELPLPIRIVGEARNGEELLELARTTSPDLIFVDIRMPKMDGLEAIRQGKAHASGASWVILTGFSEFKYAQEAIRLGASRYLLKPADPEEVEKCVLEAIEEQNKSAYYLNYEFEHWMTMRFRLLGSQKVADAAGFDAYRLSGTTLYLCNPDSKPNEIDVLQRLAADIQQSIAKKTEFKEVRSAIVSPEPDSLSIYWAMSRERNGYETLFEAIERQAYSVLSRNSNLAVHVAKTGVCEDLSALLRRTEELRALSPLRAFFPFHDPLTALQLRAEGDKPDRLYVAEGLEQLINLFRSKDYVSYLQKVAALKKLNCDSFFRDVVPFRHACRYLAESIGSEVRADMSPTQWFHCLHNQGDKLLSESGTSMQTDKTDVIQKVADFVDKRYMEDIAIGTLAGEFNVTPNYLSTLFRKRHGVTFVKYLTNTRMLKAKELLLTKSGIKVHEVAQAVGYFSTRHFTKLFHEHYGCYPSEIRERVGQGKEMS